MFDFSGITYLSSELVNEIVEAWNFWLESLSGSDSEGDLTGEGLWIKRIATELLPMVEDALREGTARSCSAKSLSETE